MQYIDPIKYSKHLKTFSNINENKEMPEMAIPPDGYKKVSMKEKIAKLSQGEIEELNQYFEAIKEIKRKINEIVNGAGKVEEVGGDTTNLHLNPEE